MTIFASPIPRIHQPELMDNPALAADEHMAALKGLMRLNLLAGSTRILWSPLVKLSQQLSRPCLRILDVATGAGDIPLGLWHRARRQGLDWEIHGVDVSPRAVEWARGRARRAKAPVHFHTVDALEDDFPTACDVAICSLFLHHLSTTQAVLLLGKMAQAASHAVLVHDLRRSRGSVRLARWAARLFTNSPVVFADAERSAFAAYTPDELRDLAIAAGLAGTTVEPRWPYRLLLTWERS